MQGHNIYLGLPTFSLRSKRLQFGYLRERIDKKINDWSNRFFSAGGREVLIKSILQAIPSYAMSCFKIPISVCRAMEQSCARFWWKDASGRRGVHWLNWKNLCKPKMVGGMGFRCLTTFNKALLAKQIWRVIQSPQSLLARTLKSRYFKNSDIMQARAGYKPSYIWRSMLWSRDIIRKGIYWRVGNGNKIGVLDDPWIPSFPTIQSSTYIHAESSLKVSNFISESGRWYEHLVRQLFPNHISEAILDIPLNRRGCEDIRFWSGSKNGKYSVKSGYHVDTNCWSTPSNTSRHPLSSWWKTLWNLRLPPKIRIFMWKASRDFIPTEVNLMSHHISIIGQCSLCRFHCASTSHCLIFCNAVKHVWKKTSFWGCLKSHSNAKFLDCAIYMSKICNQDDFELFVTLCWAIWWEYCKWKHDNDGKISNLCVDWAFAFFEVVHASSSKCVLQEDARQMKTASPWIPPAPNLFRLDVDAGFDILRNKFSVGAIIRDSEGLTRGAHAICIRNPGSVLAAELLAIRYGLDLCLQVGLSQVCIYSDSKEAVRAVLNPSSETGPPGVLAIEINSIFRDNHFISIMHMSRVVNVIAHFLAHKASALSSDFIWLDGNIPSWLYCIVNRDCPT